MSDMNTARRAAAKAAERAHQKARLLASEEIDAKLSPSDATWLAVHLRGCAASSVYAGHIAAQGRHRRQCVEIVVEQFRVAVRQCQQPISGGSVLDRRGGEERRRGVG